MKQLNTYKFFIPYLIILHFACSFNYGQAINTSSVYLSKYGAKGDGITNDYKAFAKAFEDVSDGGSIYFESKMYYIDGLITVKDKSIKLIGNKKSETIIISKGSFLKIQNTPQYQFNSLPLKKSTHTLVNTNIEKILPNSLIFFQSEELFEEQVVLYKKQYCSKISSANSKKFELKYALGINMLKNNINISIYKPKSLTISNISFKSENALYIVEARNFSKIIVQNCNFSTKDSRVFGIYKHRPDLGTSGLGLFSSTDIVIKKCSFNYLWYGILCHSGCNNVLIDRCTALKSHHINNSALGSDGITISNCITTECESGYDSHETSIELTLSNCKDIKSVVATRLRGRRDVAINCHFEKGIEMIYDMHSGELFQSDSLYKKLTNCTVFGGLSNFIGHNISLINCRFYDAVVFSYNSGKISIIACDFIDKGLKQSNRNEMLTISDLSWKDKNYDFVISKCLFLGKFKVNQNTNNNRYSMGVYFPMTAKCRGEFTNSVIKNFYKGLVLYGGLDSRESYKRLSIDALQIEDCEIGVFQQDFQKKLRKNKILIKNCTQNDNFPKNIILNKDDSN